MGGEYAVSIYQWVNGEYAVSINAVLGTVEIDLTHQHYFSLSEQIEFRLLPSCPFALDIHHIHPSRTIAAIGADEIGEISQVGGCNMINSWR